MNLAALAELSATLALLSFAGWLLFSITGGGPGRAGHRGTKNRLGIAPSDQDGPVGSGLGSLIRGQGS